MTTKKPKPKVIKDIEKHIEDELSESIYTPPSAETDEPTIEDIAKQLLQFPDEPLPDSYLIVLCQYIEQHHPNHEVIEKKLSPIQKAIPTVERLIIEAGFTQMNAATRAKEKFNLSNSEESITRELRRSRKPPSK